MAFRLPAGNGPTRLSRLTAKRVRGTAVGAFCVRGGLKRHMGDVEVDVLRGVDLDVVAGAYAGAYVEEKTAFAEGVSNIGLNVQAATKPLKSRDHVRRARTATHEV
jgi:hypothetical protein